MNSNNNNNQFYHENKRIPYNINDNQVNNNNSKIRKIGEYKLKLKSNFSDFKVGKINDIYNPTKCLIEKESNSKGFKLSEKKNMSNDSEIRNNLNTTNISNSNLNKEKTINYSGALMADQTSKYLIFSTKPEANNIEIFPAENWYMFKKDITYKTINSDEVEDKLKFRPQMIEYLKNKINVNSKPLKNKTKDKEKKEINTNNLGGSSNRPKTKKFEEDSYNNNDDDELFNSPKKNKEKKNYLDESLSEKESLDLSLKEIPSDLEENFFGKPDKKKIKLFDSNEEIEKSENLDEDEDSLFEDDENEKKENSEVDDDDDDISEIDRKYGANYDNSNFFILLFISNNFIEISL